MNQNKVVTFGKHLVFDAYGCPLEKLNSKEICNKILYDLVEVADMKVLMDAHIIESDGTVLNGGKDPGGFSGFLMIEESHISIHTFAKRGFVTIDLYSCKQFDVEGILEYLVNMLEPKDYDVFTMDRGLKYPIENIYE